MPGRPIARLGILELITTAASHAFGSIVAFAGLFILPWATGNVAALGTQVFLHEQFGWNPGDVVGDLAWAPFAAMALVPMARYASRAFLPAGWLHLEWSRSIAVVAVLMVIWTAVSWVLDLALAQYLNVVSSRVVSSSSFNLRTDPEVDYRRLMAWYYPASCARHLLEAVLVSVLVPLALPAIFIGGPDLTRPERFLKSAWFRRFLLVFLAGLVCAAARWGWEFLVSIARIPSEDLSFVTWRQYLVYEVARAALRFPVNLVVFAFEASLLVLIWRDMAEQVGVEHGPASAV